MIFFYCKYVNYLKRILKVRYLILYIFFFNIQAFVNLNFLRTESHHTRIKFKHCQEFDDYKDKLFFLGYAYLFEEENALVPAGQGTVAVIKVLRKPIALKNDNTFYQNVGNKWYNDELHGNFRGCSNDELLFDYKEEGKTVRKKIELPHVIFFRRNSSYDINTHNGKLLYNCTQFNKYFLTEPDRIPYFTDNKGIYYAAGTKSSLYENYPSVLFSYQEFNGLLAWNYTIDFDRDEVFRYNDCIDTDKLEFVSSKQGKKIFDLKELTFFDPRPNDTLPTYYKPSFASIIEDSEDSEDHEIAILHSCEEVLKYFPEYNHLVFANKHDLFSTRGNLNFLFRKRIFKDTVRDKNEPYTIDNATFLVFNTCHDNSLYFKSFFGDLAYNLVIPISDIKFHISTTVMNPRWEVEKEKYKSVTTHYNPTFRR